MEIVNSPDNSWNFNFLRSANDKQPTTTTCRLDCRSRCAGLKNSQHHRRQRREKCKQKSGPVVGESAFVDVVWILSISVQWVVFIFAARRRLGGRKASIQANFSTNLNKVERESICCQRRTWVTLDQRARLSQMPMTWRSRALETMKKFLESRTLPVTVWGENMLKALTHSEQRAVWEKIKLQFTNFR